MSFKMFGKERTYYIFCKITFFVKKSIKNNSICINFFLILDSKWCVRSKRVQIESEGNLYTKNSYTINSYK